jgi:hypothetical protein
MLFSSEGSYRQLFLRVKEIFPGIRIIILRKRKEVKKKNCQYPFGTNQVHCSPLCFSERIGTRKKPPFLKKWIRIQWRVKFGWR